MNKLNLSKELLLPPSIVTQKVAWLGTTGSGKTYGASKLAEDMWDISAQFVVLDPVGVWYGLRLQEDGKKPSSIDIPIFGGLHGDVPLESTAGELLANLIVDKGLSCVIDVSQFESDAEKTRFATAFADRLFFRKKSAPSAIHLFLEECQEFVPQNPQKGEERMLHAFIRMQKLGRNFGIGSSYITQRPQEVNKKALNMAQNLFVFRNTGTHERAAIEKWIEDKSLDESIAQDLPKLETGTCHIWSPEFLKVSKIIHISKKRTFNASATPEVGAVAKSRQLAPIDLEKVRKEMTATIEKAKAEDPKELKKKIVELERMNKGLLKNPFQKDVTVKDATEIARPLLIANDRKWQVEVAKANKEIQRLSKVMFQINKLSNEPTAMVVSGPEKIDVSKYKAGEVIRTPHTIHPSEKSLSDFGKSSFYSKSPAQMALETSDDVISNPEKKILNAIAWFESIGNNEPDQAAVSFLAGYSVNGGAFKNPRGSLRVKGLVEYRGNSIVLTDAGRELAEAPQTTLTNDELHQKVLSVLPAPERKILKEILNVYPASITNEDLANSVGYDANGGAYKNPRGRLRSLGLIDYRDGMVVARDILFI